MNALFGNKAAGTGFLALGDSYTIGEGVAERERWPVQLAALLRERRSAVDEPQIIAHTGWTTADLLAAMDAARLGRDFALVTLLIGVNDQYRGGAASTYRTPFRTALQRATVCAGGTARRVVVLSIPDWGATPFARADARGQSKISAEIDAFNAVSKAECIRAGVAYVDVTPYSRAVGSDPRSLLVADGLHPSGRMYANWARLALPAASAALGGH